MTRKTFGYIFYTVFVLIGALSIGFVPGALSYPYGSAIAICIISFPLVVSLYKKFGIQKTVVSFFVLSLFALAIEYTGLVTGWPYGHFEYTGELGARIFGILPWTVGFSWTPLMLGAVAMVYPFTHSKTLRILLPVVVLVVFDLLLDPVAVSVGMWQFAEQGIYYGVPFRNFVGWGISGLIGSQISYFLFSHATAKQIAGLGTSFYISIALWTLVALFRGLYIPALVGALLGATVVVIHYRYAKNTRN
jgi:putative membrane protein